MTKKMILAAVCCFPLSLLAQEGFTIHGKLGTLDAPAKAYLSYNLDGKRVTDSVLLGKGSFTFSGILPLPTMAVLSVKHDTLTRDMRAGSDALYFYIENANITVTAKDSIRYASVEGSATNDDEKELRALQRPYRKMADAQMAEYRSKTPEEQKDSAYVQRLREDMNSTQAGYDSVNRAFIAAHPGSYIALQTFQEVELGYNFNPDSAARRFMQLSPALRESPAGKELTAIIETSRKTMTGVEAMDFTQNDTTGRPVKLSDFRGKYVLVDFWASWCKPCRAENPNLLAAYNKYKGRNFTILGVSLDDEDGRRAWLGAVKKDGLPWTQVSELKGFQSKTAVMYGVSAIPSNFLIDPNGRIIARNLRGEELEKKLGELFRM